MHPRDHGLESFCRHKFAGIRALAPEAVAELDDGAMDHYDPKSRQTLLEVLEKLVIDLKLTEREAFAKRVEGYRRWTQQKLQLQSEHAFGLPLGGITHQTLCTAVDIAQDATDGTPKGKKVGRIMARRFLELACFHVERNPSLRLVVSNDPEDLKEEFARSRPTGAKLRLVR